MRIRLQFLNPRDLQHGVGSLTGGNRRPQEKAMALVRLPVLLPHVRGADPDEHGLHLPDPDEHQTPESKKYDFMRRRYGHAVPSETS